MNKALGQTVRAGACLAAAALYFGGAAPADAALLLYDPFAYPEESDRGLGGVNGQSLTPPSSPVGYTAPNGKPYFTTAWANFNPPETAYRRELDALVTPQNLVVGGLATSSGNAVTYGSSGYSPRIEVGTIAAGDTAYYSMAVQINDLGNLQTAGGFISAFNNSVGSQAANPTTVAAPVWIRAGSTPNTFNVGISRSGSNPTYDTVDRNLGETLFIVASQQQVAGTVNDVANLYVNPDPSSFGGAAPAPTVTAQTTTGGDYSGTNIRSFIFRQGNTLSNVNPAVVIADELRVGTSYADVTPVPEPASAAALGIAALAVLGRRRRRRA